MCPCVHVHSVQRQILYTILVCTVCIYVVRTDLLVLLENVGQRPWNDSSVRVPLSTARDGECLARASLDPTQEGGREGGREGGNKDDTTYLKEHMELHGKMNEAGGSVDRVSRVQTHLTIGKDGAIVSLKTAT